MTLENKNHIGIVISNEKVANETYKLEFLSGDIKNINPGQFVSILCPNLTLRRPFSVANFNCQKKEITVYYRKKGQGTEYLTTLKKDDEIIFSGPFGNGFNIENDKKSLLVGAGIGVAPLFFLKKKIEKSIFIAGFKSEDEVFHKYDYIKIGGSIVDDVERIIWENNIQKVYSCGPKIVLEKVYEICKKLKISNEIAFEKVMACGIGVCKGCTINIKDGKIIRNVTVCKDGPVFKGESIIW